MKRIGLLPLDDRPVNYDYPEILARSAGVDLLRPPREWLGNPWRDSRHGELVDWFSETSGHVDGLVVALDTLAYGGLIRMRVSHEDFESVRTRLSLLERVKAAHPELPIVASSVIQRICRANTSEEEMPYWSVYGGRMFRLSYLEHKSGLSEASQAEIDEIDKLRREIPPEVIADYLGIRTRNHAVNRLALDWVERGTLDYLILPQDDTADYGWNIAEARRLQADIRTRGLSERAITYPGADEIGCLLLARLICQAQQFFPRVYLRFSSGASANVITDYEDRPMQEMVKAHLAPLNGILADDPQRADLVLYINAPAMHQGNADLQWIVRSGLDGVRKNLPPEFLPVYAGLENDPNYQNTRREMETPLRSPEELVRSMLTALHAGQPVALADVAFVNGCDLALAAQLAQHPEIGALAGFAGWNTAGNTLGTVLAQAIIRLASLRSGASPAQTAAHMEFLFTRFLDDYAYQALERARCLLEDLPAMGLRPTEERIPDEKANAVRQCVERRLMLHVQQLERVFVDSGMVKSIEVTSINLPWQRLFEVGFKIEVALPDSTLL